MEKKEDGSYIFSREELLDDKCKVLAKIYPLEEHQFHVLIKNGDSYFDVFAGKVFFIALGVLLQIAVIILFVCYYHFSHNKVMLESTLSRLDKIQIGLLFVCLFVSGGLKIIGSCIKSERKQLITVIKSHFKK